MGLKDLKSDLTSLDYPDGGTWLGGPNQRPLMTKPLIDFSGNIGSAIDTFTGGLIRGGAATHVERNLTDVARIGKFLITPKGIAFIAKQVGLQLSNPRIDKPSRSDLQPANPLKGSPANQRIYNLGVNTLASIAASGTGVRFDREGLIPGVHEGYIDATNDKYPDLFADSTEGEVKKDNENRLLYLHQEKITKLIGEEILEEPQQPEKKGLKKLISKVGEFLKGGGTGEELYSYQGGPGSLYGIGKTTIRRYEDTGGAFDYSSHELNGTTTIKNYLLTLGKPGFDYSRRTTDLNLHYNREERIGLGNPGAQYKGEGERDMRINVTNKDGTLNYNVYNSQRTDKVNMMDVVDIDDGDFRGDGFRDLIRFRFEAIKPTEPTKTEAMVFRAFLDDFSDNYSANHNEIKYNGRAENFYTYNSFNRDIGLSFKIAAQSRHEMMPLYRKLNFLASNTAPEYHGGGRIMTPYIRLTVGSYLNRVPGVLKSIGIKWQKDYPWEISIDGPENGMDTHMLVLPHVLDVSVSFQPIHNFLPKKSVSESPFIFPHHDNRDGMVKPLQKWGSLPAMPLSLASTLGAERLQRLHMPTKIETKKMEPLPVETDMDPILPTSTYPPPPEEHSGGEEIPSDLA